MDEGPDSRGGPGEGEDVVSLDPMRRQISGTGHARPSGPTSRSLPHLWPSLGKHPGPSWTMQTREAVIPGRYDAPMPLRWLIPIRGVFQSIHERWSDPFNESPMSPLSLEANVTWRAVNETDREAKRAWFEFYRDYVSKDDAEAWVFADSLLEGEDASTSEGSSAPTRANEITVAFLLAASLHTQCYLRARWLRFDQSEGVQRPNSGGQPVEFSLLPGWPRQQPLEGAARERIAHAYSHVRRAWPPASDHSFGRALEAYRVAMTARFLEATAILREYGSIPRQRAFTALPEGGA